MAPLLSCFLFFVLEVDSNTENPMVSNKYKNWCYGSSHNIHNYNIEPLLFEMVYHYSQRSPCTVMHNIFWLTTTDVVIGNSTGLFMILREMKIKKQKEIIWNMYNYWWYQSNRNTTNLQYRALTTFYSDHKYVMIDPYR